MVRTTRRVGDVSSQIAVNSDRLFDFFDYQKVADTEHCQRRLLKSVGERSQAGPYDGLTGIDTIVAGEDLRVPLNKNRQPDKQIQKTALSIRSHMWGKLIAHEVGQIVYQRRIAEAVDALPVMTVRLKGKEPIGYEDDSAPADAQHADDFGRGPAVILHMLQHFVRQDQVEASIGVGELLTLAEVEWRVRHISGRRPQMLSFNIHPVDFRDGLLQRPQIDAYTATVNQRALPRLRRPFEDHLQAPFLAGAPNERRIAAQCCAV